jgi:Arc/MetJ family transcription regulator
MLVLARYVLMMRTTIRLDELLMVEAKKRTAEKGTTLTTLIEDSLREGLQPGVDLDDTSSLLDRMDGFDSAN